MYRGVALAVGLMLGAGSALVMAQGVTVSGPAPSYQVLRVYPVVGGWEIRDPVGAPLFRIENAKLRVIGELVVDGKSWFKTPPPPWLSDGAGGLMGPNLTVPKLHVTGDATFDGATIGVKFN
jgi:hypothetical protein